MTDVRVSKLNNEFSLEKLNSILPTDKRKFTIAEAMALAIYIAYQGAQRVSPNPLVGCVILDQNGCFLSKGCHQVYGEAHAEINALKNLDSEHLQGATMVVTLEPCAHVGQTGSCALRIKDLPINRIVYGLEDPNPLVSGKGAQILKNAGKEVILFSNFIDQADSLSSEKVGQNKGAIIQKQLEIVAENFMKNFRFQRPFVALKWAQSIDGRMALRNFESQWITNEQSRNYAHYLRSVYDATLIGARTILKDNPKLNIRIDGVQKENKLVIVDPKGTVYQSFEKLEISKYHRPENVFFVVDANAAERAAAFDLEGQPPGAFKNVFFLKRNLLGTFPLSDIHQFCFERKMKSILVEGGPSTLNQYFIQGVYDRVYSFIAPVFLGNGLGYSDEFLISSMSQTPVLTSVEKRDLGDDILITGLKAEKR